MAYLVSMGSPGLVTVRETTMRPHWQNLSVAPASVVTSQPALWPTFAAWSHVSRGVIITVITAVMMVITGYSLQIRLLEAIGDLWA